MADPKKAPTSEELLSRLQALEEDSLKRQEQHEEREAAFAKMLKEKEAELANREREFVAREEATRAALKAAGQTPQAARNGKKSASTSLAAHEGDVTCVCMKTQISGVKAGPRVYIFEEGKEISMDPNHAEEYRQSGWVRVLAKRG
jgi:hypothetical protein